MRYWFPWCASPFHILLMTYSCCPYHRPQVKLPCISLRWSYRSECLTDLIPQPSPIPPHPITQSYETHSGDVSTELRSTREKLVSTKSALGEREKALADLEGRQSELKP